MALLPSNGRDQKMLVVRSAALALAGGVLVPALEPEEHRARRGAGARRLARTVINQRAKAELAQGKTAQLKAEAEQYDAATSRSCASWSRRANEVPVLLEQVSTAARRVGLDISDVQPLPQLTGDQYDAYKYRMSVRGDYHQIGVFLTNVGIAAAHRRADQPVAQPAGGAAAQPKVAAPQPLDARFEIQTYVARTARRRSRATPKLEPEPSKPGER